MPVVSRSTIRKVFLALGLALLVAGPASAQNIEKGISDTFGLADKTPVTGNGAEWSAKLARTANSDEIVLTVSVKLASEHYVYPTTYSDGELMEFEILKSTGLKPTGDNFVADREPKVVFDADFGKEIPKFYGEVAWSRTYRVVPGADPAQISIIGKVVYQICNKQSCTPGQIFKINVSLGDGGRSTVVEADSVDAPNVAENPAVMNDENDDESDVSRLASMPLPVFLGTAMVFGFAALLTPCVFPMIPITVSFFQKQSEKEHHRPITTATVYCIGIIAAFTGLGMVMSILYGATALNDLANTVLFNVCLALLLLFFAANLLGMFEIRIPSWLLTYTASKEGKGGFIGVLFMSLTFTLTSFTCTFAFAGALLVMAQDGDRLRPILGLMAFSLAFSLPFFFLALFPSMLKKLPKSGGWMNIAKVLMGLLELGAAVKFLGNADQQLNGQPAFFDFQLMVALWAVISVGAAIYLFGFIRLPHDMPTERIGVARFVTAISLLTFAMYLGSGLFGAHKPQGLIWKNVEAFANSTFETAVAGDIGPINKHGNLEYSLDFEKAMARAVKEGKPLFLDFTGVNCTNCRRMEKGPMSTAEIESRLGKFIRVQLYADRVPIDDRAEAKRLKTINLELQQRLFGEVTLPTYAVLPPTEEALKDKSLIYSRFSGYDADASKFAKFLDRGLRKWQKAQAGKVNKVSQVVDRR